MSDTQARLDAYKAAEARTLQAQEVRGGGGLRRNADLIVIRQAIKDLEAQVAAEQRAAAGLQGPQFLVGGFNHSYRDRGGF